MTPLFPPPPPPPPSYGKSQEVHFSIFPLKKARFHNSSHECFSVWVFTVEKHSNASWTMVSRFPPINLWNRASWFSFFPIFGRPYSITSFFFLIFHRCRSSAVKRKKKRRNQPPRKIRKSKFWKSVFLSHVKFVKLRSPTRLKFWWRCQFTFDLKNVKKCSFSSCFHRRRKFYPIFLLFSHIVDMTE